MCFGVSSAGQLFYTNIAKKQTNLIPNVIYVFQFHLNLHSIYLGGSKKVNPKNVQGRACFDFIMEKPQMTQDLRVPHTDYGNTRLRGLYKLID